MAPRKLDILIAHPDQDVRTRLKTASVSIADFGKCIQATSLPDAVRRIEDPELQQLDVIFLSGQIPTEAMAEYIKRAKEAPKTQDAAFIMLMGSNVNSNSAMATSLLTGTDGFLCEPYSVDQLLEITKTAARVRGERAVTRETVAVKLLLKDIIKCLDVLWRLRALSYDGGGAYDKLRQACSRLSLLSEDSRSVYYKMVLEAFELLPTPECLAKGGKYDGKSARTRQKLERVLQNRLDSESTLPVPEEVPPPGMRVAPPRVKR